MRRSRSLFLSVLFSLLAASAVAQSGTGIIETIAGTAPFQSPAKATSIGLGSDGGVVADSAGNVYVATGELGVVLKVDPSGNATVYAGKPLPSGPAVDSGDGGPATSARIVTADSLAIDSSGNLYIAEEETSVIRRVDAVSGTISTIAGTEGVGGFGPDGVAATKSQIAPFSLAVDNAGHLFFGGGPVVREVDLSSQMIETVAGSEQLSAQNTCSLSSAGTCPAMQVSFESNGIAVFGSHLYIAAPLVREFNTLVQESDLGGTLLDIDLPTKNATILAGGTPSNTGPYQSISAVATDATGDVVYTNVGQGVLIRIDAQSHASAVIAGPGTPGSNGAGGPATSAYVAAPQSLGITPQGAVLVRILNNVISFPVGGTVSAVAGDGLPNDFGDGGPALQAGLDQPLSLAFDSSGNLLIAERGNAAIRRIDGQTGVTTTLASNAQRQSLPAPFPTDGFIPWELAVKGQDLLITTGESSLVSLDLVSGAAKTLLNGIGSGTTPLATNGPVRTDGTTVYTVAAQARVIALDSTGASTVVAGGGFSNGLLTTGPPDGGLATAGSFLEIGGLALDGKGHLYISDNSANVIRVVDLPTDVIGTVAGTPTPFGGTGRLLGRRWACDGSPTELSGTTCRRQQWTPSDCRHFEPSDPPGRSEDRHHHHDCG